ncbi:hypothetical protein Kpol_1055p55 [Vanderwaltozyma polyspora DSM 70294]|uniref:Protein PUN1 n=1 Tax=Vanderwaltozyma polyspora (strain ATCC 22028 / DSM 70294 / BCRC 21397 / CBS 2163 / NBRC 10782 / NRRL Y-8283 / UCD 57-17) TaxID=436907 RepID=A7TGC8_VANPO|nr:uncharacterized protein Kpol_1055p55 [Vanderwaltozyma polyspora DSM 70294]EDO18698.1 hypothetical protein Kpol_1055p55 [Vanderwaltozyma polyspora DSM 70294]
MANRFRLFVAALISFTTFIIAIIGCAGSTSNYNPINKIYVAQLNLRKIKQDTVFDKISQDIGTDILPGYINIGLWSYCTSSTDSKHVEKCTSPHGIQQFDLQTLLGDSVNNNQATKLIESIEDIIIPDKLEDKKGYYNNLAKCMFITLIIGICLMFINFVVIIFRFLVDSVFFTVLGIFFSATAFVSLLISGGTSVGTYVYIKHQLSQNYDEFGISLDLGRDYYCLIWGAILGSLLNFMIWCTVRSKPRGYVTRSAAPEKRIIL